MLIRTLIFYVKLKLGYYIYNTMNIVLKMTEIKLMNSGISGSYNIYTQGIIRIKSLS